ncbi:MAG: APC family permease [Actinomycetota bacterium]|nr:MAG: APC family permease [Actinomycetota bacterium]
MVPKAQDKVPNALKQNLKMADLVALSVSSVGPLFSIAATGGVMAANAGLWTIPSIGLIAIPFILASFIFRLLNKHFPHAGASYHWSGRVLGIRASRFQAWILILAYFTSIPPIIIPAANYTLNLVFPAYHPSTLAEIIAAMFWSGFALIPLLRGSRPTAKLTQIFLAVELLSVAAVAVVAILRWQAISVPMHFGKPPIGGMVITAVVAATILDGWEIDSYASEESVNPKGDPGIGGIIGALMALGFYALVYPLMFGETPLALLSGAPNPMSVWAQRLLPHASFLMLIPVLASTAGGLWLTSFILIRALHAMGREGLVFRAFGKVNSRGVPGIATIATLGAAFAVTILQALFSSLSSFFGLVLSTAGFFLVAEFFLDSVTASVFLFRMHTSRVDGASHRHRVLLAGSVISAVTFLMFMIGFFIFGPKAIGSSVDYVVGILIAIGFAFVFFAKRHTLIYVFHGNAAVPQIDAGLAGSVDAAEV